MKDEVLEIIAPDALPRVRRWRPYLRGLEIFLIVLALLAHGIYIHDMSVDRIALAAQTRVLFIVLGWVALLAPVILMRVVVRGGRYLGFAFAPTVDRYLIAIRVVLWVIELENMRQLGFMIRTGQVYPWY
jgi:hypothetical protein